MKVKAADEVKLYIAKRRSVRWMGVRGMKSKSADGVYGVFFRKQQINMNYRLTQLLAVYEPQTAMWYTSEEYAAQLRAIRLDLPEPASQIRWVNAAWLLQDVYKHGYTVLAQARLMGLV